MIHDNKDRNPGFRHGSISVREPTSMIHDNKDRNPPLYKLDDGQGQPTSMIHDNKDRNFSLSGWATVAAGAHEHDP